MTYKDHHDKLLKEAKDAYDNLLKERAKFYTDEASDDGFKDASSFRKPVQAYQNWQEAEGRYNAFLAHAAKNGLKPDDSFVEYTEEES